MNCWKFATIKSGTITSGFTIKVKEQTEDATQYSSTISKSSPLNLNLTYKDLCRIDRGVEVGKPWAIRGPRCDRYHTYKGVLPVEGFLGPYGSYSYLVGGYGTYDLYFVISYNLFGCAYEDFSGRLNAYGRKAKKAKDAAPPPDPDSPEPCITQGAFFLLGVPEGTQPDNDIGQNIIIQYSASSLILAYGSANNEPYTSTGTIVMDTRNPGGENEVGQTILDVEIIGTRNLEITDTYGQ